MAVGRLTGKWLLEILRTTFPDGVLRRALLDHFASVLVSKRSSPGAKGRLARRLYSRIDLLQRQGHLVQEEGIIRPAASRQERQGGGRMPPLGPLLRKKQFLALLAEDSNEDGPNAPRLRAARWGFLASAVEAGWDLAQAAGALGIPTAKAAAIIAEPQRRDDRSP